MSSDLTRIPFTEESLPKVQGFDCGDEPWEREVSDWIKAPLGEGGALDELQQGSHVWLYVNEADVLDWFGSLCITMQRCPRSKDPQIVVRSIPMLGVDRKFWGQPLGPVEDRYSIRILADLIAEARKHQDERPILILFVHIE